MRALVTTLRTRLSEAESLLSAGRFAAARAAFETLVEHAQEKADRPIEVIARASLARIHVRRRDTEAARTELAEAKRVLDAEHLESAARYRSARVRLIVLEGDALVFRRELQEYLYWAEERRLPTQAVDACLLLAEHSDPGERIDWLERGIDLAVEHGVHRPLGRAYNELATALDAAGRMDRALEAYQQALAWNRRVGEPRQVVASAWAVGATAVRLAHHPLAQEHLEEASRLAGDRDDCDDLLALTLGDLALVYDASGDPIEARRALIKALKIAQEQELGTIWPARWDRMQRQAEQLGL